MKFLKKEEIPEIIHDAFWSLDYAGQWSVHYGEGENSRLMDKATALSYARMFKAPYIFKAQGFLRGIIIEVDPKEWV